MQVGCQVHMRQLCFDLREWTVSGQFDNFDASPHLPISCREKWNMKQALFEETCIVYDIFCQIQMQICVCMRQR